MQETWAQLPLLSEVAAVGIYHRLGATGLLLLLEQGEGATPVAALLGYSVGKRDLGANSCFVACSTFSSQWIKYPQKTLGNCGFSPAPGSGITGSLMFASLD